MTNHEGTCSRCERPYFEEIVDNGLCCICNRDDRMTAELGDNWREVLSCSSQEADA